MPVVGRELRVAARRPMTYRVRLLAAAIALVVLFCILLQNASMFGARTPPGAVAFAFLTVLAMAYCLFEGLRSTSDCLSAEKRQGTLGLLFLTDLTGRDVVLGKLAATSLNSLYGLLAIVPILGITLLAGGVTGGEFWRVALVLANTLMFSLAFGLWVSARSRDAYNTAVATLAGMAALTGGPLLLDEIVFNRSNLFSLGSPAYNCYLAFSASFVSTPGRFWCSLALVHLLSWYFIIQAGRYVARHWQETDETPVPEDRRRTQWRSFRLQTRLQTKLRLAPAQRKQWLTSHPARWLTHHFQKPHWMIWLPAILATGMIVWQSMLYPAASITGPNPYYVFISMLSLLSTVLFYLTIAARAGRCFVETRGSGILALVCCTPLSPHDLIEGQRFVLRPLYYHLVLSGILLHLCSFSSQFAMYKSIPANVSSQWLIQTGVGQVGGLIVYFMDLRALSWMSMWLALKQRNLNQVITKAFVWVIVLPWLGVYLVQFNLVWIARSFLSGGYLSYVLFMLIIPLAMIVKDYIFINYASKKLDTQFRRLITEDGGVTSD